MEKEFNIELGAMCDEISVQLLRQNLSFDKGDIKFCQRVSDAISLLHIKQYIGDKQSEAARKKLVKNIQEAILPRKSSKADSICR